MAAWVCHKQDNIDTALQQEHTLGDISMASHHAYGVLRDHGGTKDRMREPVVVHVG